MKYTTPTGEMPIEPKDEFLMNLKFGTAANAIEHLLAKVRSHDNIDLRIDETSDAYNELIVYGCFEWTNELYAQPSDINSWTYFEELLANFTGVSPTFADYQDQGEVYYEFSAPADFSTHYSFISWIGALEELLHVADMKDELMHKLEIELWNQKENTNV